MEQDAVPDRDDRELKNEFTGHRPEFVLDETDTDDQTDATMEVRNMPDPTADTEMPDDNVETQAAPGDTVVPDEGRVLRSNTHARSQRPALTSKRTRATKQLDAGAVKIAKLTRENARLKQANASTDERLKQLEEQFANANLNGGKPQPSQQWQSARSPAGYAQQQHGTKGARNSSTREQPLAVGSMVVGNNAVEAKKVGAILDGKGLAGDGSMIYAIEPGSVRGAPSQLIKEVDLNGRGAPRLPSGSIKVGDVAYDEHDLPYPEIEMGAWCDKKSNTAWALPNEKIEKYIDPESFDPAVLAARRKAESLADERAIKRAEHAVYAPKNITMRVPSDQAPYAHMDGAKPSKFGSKPRMYGCYARENVTNIADMPKHWLERPPARTRENAPYDKGQNAFQRGRSVVASIEGPNTGADPQRVENGQQLPKGQEVQNSAQRQPDRVRSRSPSMEL